MPTVAIVLACAFIMMLVEYRQPGRHFQASRHWRRRAIAANLVQAGSFWLTALTWDRWLPQWPLMAGHEWPFQMQVLVGYLLITFVYYWWHRARHQVPLLWRWLHQLHHSPVRLEILTSFYKHPLEIACNGFLSAFVLYVLLGVSPAAAAVTVLITGVAELFYHWNVRTPYWLGFFFQRPESHCIHHQRNHHRQNFSDLPLWDMLFGTFHNPRQPVGDCGFADAREQQWPDMLLGRDVHTGSATPANKRTAAICPAGEQS